MYSVVLATMLAAGSTTPAWHHHHSCYSCYANCYSSCGGYAGYSGYGHYSGYGCYSGCSCSTCFGCHRIFPIFHRHHCHSSCFCSCSCTGVVYYSSCSVCCGGPVYYYGCTGCTICCGGVVTQPRVVPVPEKIDPPGKDKDQGVSIPASKARVTVMVPSDAKLWVENVVCPLTSTVRSFDTPSLNPNQRYFYNIRAEIVRDGRTISETQRVVIIPGQEARVDFTTTGVIATASR
jgi:uncharacterized protein (TIGR03000 family)